MMSEEFTVGVRFHREWEHLVALSFSLEGIGAGLILCAVLAGSQAAVLVGLLLVTGGVAALFAHLGNRRRFWRVVSNPATAWISRGSLLIGMLLVFGLLSLAAGLLDDPPAWAALATLAMGSVAAVLVGYAGLLLASMAGIPFWSSALAPALFALHSLTSGAALLLALAALTGETRNTPGVLEAAVLVLLVLTLAGSMVYPSLTGATRAARDSAHSLLRGEYRLPFLGGAVGLGLLVPILLVVAHQWLLPGAGAAALLVVAALLRLGGDLCFRYALIGVGSYDPLL
jgi:formate-dependent nitrite reductase membrane component NrfD